VTRPLIVHLADLSTLGDDAAATLARTLRARDDFAHRTVASADPLTRAALDRHRNDAHAFVPARPAPARPRAVAVRRKIESIAGATAAPIIIQPWGRRAATAAHHARLQQVAPVAPALDGAAPGDWPAAEPSEADRRLASALRAPWDHPQRRLVAFHAPRPPAPLDASPAAYHTGVPAMADPPGVALIQPPAVRGADRALKLTAGHDGRWITAFANAAATALAAAADLVVFARASPPQERVGVPSLALTAAAARRPMIIERRTVGMPEPEERHPAFTATTFVDPRNRLSVSRAVFAAQQELDAASRGEGDLTDRLDAAARAAADLGDPERWLAARRETWRRLIRSAGLEAATLSASAR